MATAASAAVARANAVTSAPVRHRSGAWARWIWSVPDLLPVAIAGFSAPAIVMLLANHFIPPLALVLGVVSASVAVWLVRIEAVEIARREVVLAGVAMGIVGIWALLNLRYSAENLFAQRDSATYELTARWLVDHQSLPIHTQPDLFGSPFGSDGTSAGFQRQTDTTVFAQGNHLLPVLLATVGSVFGTTAMLKANVVLAGIALLAFFAIARRVVGAEFAHPRVGRRHERHPRPPRRLSRRRPRTVRRVRDRHDRRRGDGWLRRAGQWFAWQNWGAQPDPIPFAKGVNSGYIPLGGVVILGGHRRGVRRAGVSRAG